MEEALTVSNFCLLLWSEAASKSKWVALEWESALHKTMHDLPGFLIVGRVDESPLPHLLRSRLFVDLFPAVQPNILKVLEVVNGDENAFAKTEKKGSKPKMRTAIQGWSQSLYHFQIVSENIPY